MVPPFMLNQVQVMDAWTEAYELALSYDADLEVELELYFAYDPDLEVELELVTETAESRPRRLARGTDAPAPVDRFPLLTAEEVARAAILGRRAAATISVEPSALDDAWFGNFDETKPVEGVYVEEPATRWSRVGDWLRRRSA